MADRDRGTAARIRSREELFQLERDLADRLRRAAADERPALYAEVYDAYYRAVGPPAADARQAELLARLVAPFHDRSSTVLEIGAGDGRLARHLAPRVAQVIALEASAVVSGGVPAPPNLRWVLTREAEDAIEASSVDLAVSCHVVEHLHPDDGAEHLRQVRRWLRPGGAYVVVTPNRLLGPHDVSAGFSDVPLGFHLREYSHGELGAAMARAGFRPVQVLRGIDRPPRRTPLWRHRLAEAVLEGAGPGLRRRLFDRGWIARRRPFRPFEQVKLVGFRPDPDPLGDRGKGAASSTGSTSSL